MSVDQEPIGRWYVDISSAAVRLVDVSLLRAHRGRGIGTELLERLKADASVRRLPVRLNVFDGNPAYRLYRRLGFTEHAIDGPYRQLEWSGTRATG